MRLLSKTEKLLLSVLFIPCLFAANGLDNDIWFILNNGRYVLEHGIPHIEPFTIHAGMTYVMQQWFSAVIFWLTYSNFGEIGLKVIVILFYMLFSYMVFRLSMYLSKNNFVISYTVTFVSTIAMYPCMVERPHIFLFVLMLLEIFSFEKYIETKDKRLLLILFAISVLLVNIEAALWPALFVIWLPYLIDSFTFKFWNVESQGYGYKGMFAGAAVMFLGGFLNPYGIKAMTYLFTSYGNTELYAIKEMNPPNINFTLGLFIFALVFLVYFAIFIYRKNYRVRYILLLLGSTYLAFSAVRNFFFFIICGLIPLAYYFRDLGVDLKLDSTKLSPMVKTAAMGLMVLIAAAGCAYLSLPDENTVEQKALVQTADYMDKLNENKSSIRLYTGFNDGGYMELRGFRTFIDPRAEVFFKENNSKSDIMKEYIDLKTGKVYYRDILDKYNFTHLLVGENDILFTYLDHDSDYKLLYSNKYYKLFEKISTK